MRKYVRDAVDATVSQETGDLLDEIERLKAEIVTITSKGKINEVKLDTLHRFMHKIGMAYQAGRFGRQDVGSLVDEVLTYVFKDKDTCEYDTLKPWSGEASMPQKTHGHVEHTQKFGLEVLPTSGTMK